MSQQNDQQNQSPNSNLSNSQTANANNNTTNDQFSNFQKSSQQTQQTTAQNQQSSPQQPQTSQTVTTPQLQPATSQPSQVSVTVPVRPVSVSTKGGNAKKKTGGNKKAGGSRPKTASTEKNDEMLPQALSQMATDYYNQATQHGGQNTPEGQIYLKKYMDTVQALEQHQRNNQHASFSFVPPANQITSPATTPSPNQMSRIPATMPSVPSPMHNHQNNPQIVARPQQHQHQQHMVGRGPPINYQQLTGEINRIQTSRVTNPTSGPSQTTYNTTRPYIRPQQMISPIPDSQRMMTINTHGHSGATGSPTTQPIQSPIIPSSPLTNNIAEGSMITTMQPQTIHQSPRLHQQTQSPGSQPPPQSPRQPLSQSPRPHHHQIQPLPQSPRTQHPSQLSQTQQTLLNSHVTNPSMEIDSVQATPSTIIPKPITDGIRQITPIAPANPSGLPSPLPQHLSVTNKLQIPGVKMHTIPNLGMNLPETPASLEQEEMDRHPLSKRKIQQLVDQIDPKERLEPEVEDMLLEIADEFITSVSSFACLLAKHRKSDTLEVKDLQLHLERNWNIRIPGFASDEIRSVRKTIVPSSHQQKMLAVNIAKANKNAMIYVQVSLILFLLVSKALSSFDFTRHLGTKSLYPITSNTTPPLESPESCVLVQLHLVARHGARLPTEGDIKKFDILDKLFANIPLAQDWRNPFNYSKTGLLTDRGEHELYMLGKRARQRYYKFWNNLTYDSNVVVFQSSAVSRY
ncbi:3617_t:CDS:2 [Dentiscutata heterogama]|uniref:3617_t:CDS:1 n=1 Tax=Dentiscutata heterogama TaxID=1316150 RepID=A0ACA9K4T0_9GLOM|nr:3617_t:CDS:2 [Dentiscutata heterogama]